MMERYLRLLAFFGPCWQDRLVVCFRFERTELLTELVRCGDTRFLEHPCMGSLDKLE